MGWLVNITGLVVLGNHLCRAYSRFRKLGLGFGLVIGISLVVIGIAGTWHDMRPPTRTQTFEIAPGTATDGHLTIRLLERARNQ
jgi:hypothetical protein